MQYLKNHFICLVARQEKDKFSFFLLMKRGNKIILSTLLFITEMVIGAIITLALRQILTGQYTKLHFSGLMLLCFVNVWEYK